MMRKAKFAWIAVFLTSAVPSVRLLAQEVPSRPVPGRFVLKEPLTNDSSSSQKPPLGSVTAKDLLEDGNLVVQGNACVGDACGSNDAELPPPLRLKSMSPSILFDDVEDPESPGIGARKWALRANPGDEDQFALTDVDGAMNPLVVEGGAPGNSLVIGSNGYLGLGNTTPQFKLDLYEDINYKSGIRIHNYNTGPIGGTIFLGESDVARSQLTTQGSGVTTSRFGQTLAGWTELLQLTGNGLILGTWGETPLILGTNRTNRLRIDGSGNVTVTGNFTATGIKSFAVVDPTNAHQALYYAALEGPEAGTYIRGTARTSNGEAVIELPDHFANVTEPARMTVQLTPVGQWGQLYVAEKSPTRLRVRVAPGSSDLEFDYWVQGVRKGYLDYQVKRPNTLPQ